MPYMHGTESSAEYADGFFHMRVTEKVRFPVVYIWAFGRAEGRNYFSKKEMMAWRVSAMAVSRLSLVMRMSHCPAKDISYSALATR